MTTTQTPTTRAQILAAITKDSHGTWGVSTRTTFINRRFVRDGGEAFEDIRSSFPDFRYRREAYSFIENAIARGAQLVGRTLYIDDRN